MRMVEPMRSAPTIGFRQRRQTARGASPYLRAIIPLTSRWLVAKKAAAASAAPKNQPASPASLGRPSAHAPCAVPTAAAAERATPPPFDHTTYRP
jgi:hypothetical protein